MRSLRRRRVWLATGRMGATAWGAPRAEGANWAPGRIGATAFHLLGIAVFTRDNLVPLHLARGAERGHVLDGGLDGRGGGQADRPRADEAVVSPHADEVTASRAAAVPG